MIRFIAMVLTALRERVKPVSSIAKPTCMNMTRNPQTSTQARLSDCIFIIESTNLPTIGHAGLCGRRRITVGQPYEKDEKSDQRDEEQNDAGSAPEFLRAQVLRMEPMGAPSQM